MARIPVSEITGTYTDLNTAAVFSFALFWPDQRE